MKNKYRKKTLKNYRKKTLKKYHKKTLKKYHKKTLKKNIKGGGFLFTKSDNGISEIWKTNIDKLNELTQTGLLLLKRTQEKEITATNSNFKEYIATVCQEILKYDIALNPKEAIKTMIMNIIARDKYIANNLLAPESQKKITDSLKEIHNNIYGIFESDMKINGKHVVESCSN